MIAGRLEVADREILVLHLGLLKAENVGFVLS
jgi:hypothetical protein